MKTTLLLIFTLATAAHGQSDNAKASVLAPNAKLEKVFDAEGFLDGPASDGWSLIIPDLKAGKLIRYIPKTKKQSVLLPGAGRISGTFYTLGRLYLADNGNSQIAWLNGKTKKRLGGHDPAAKPRLAPNDLAVNHHGRIFYTLTRTGQVITIGPDGKQAVAVEKVQTPNGITLSPDGKTLYVSAYVPKEIWSYDVKEDGKCSNGKKIATMDDGPAHGADGMTTDRAGNIYCAGATDVWVWSPSGKLLDKIKTPTRPINAAFSGPDPQSLYIVCMGDKKKGTPGGLYRIATRIAGISPAPPTHATQNGKRPSTAIPNTVTANLNITYATYGDRKVLADIIRPAKSDGPRPAVVVVHGGGWLKGDKTKFRALTVALAARGYVTMAIEYRLGGEAKFPAAMHDCSAAVRYLRANAQKYNIDPKRIGAVGGSAGGHLVGLMATGWKHKDLQGNGGNADHSSQLQAAVVMAGPLQIDSGSVGERSQPGKTSNATQWLGGDITQKKDLYRLASADRHIDKDSAPTLFMAGEHDQPQRNQPSRDLFKKAGVWSSVKSYKDGKHGCWNQNPWFNIMIEDMNAFFKEHLK
jgi:gluconolactonase